jgi:chemotaxis protein CheD
MNSIVLGIGDLGATKEKGCTIKTYALGSCVAIILLAPVIRAVGMAHVALPDSSINPARAKERPGYFADTAIPLLFKEMTRLGCSDVKHDLQVKLVGGASIMDKNETFNIGKRNLLTIKKILWQYGMGPLAEDVGKNFSRTVSVAVDSGLVIVNSPGRGQWRV